MKGADSAARAAAPAEEPNLKRAGAARKSGLCRAAIRPGPFPVSYGQKKLFPRLFLQAGGRISYKRPGRFAIVRTFARRHNGPALSGNA